jgi:hypothetical protein
MVTRTQRTNFDQVDALEEIISQLKEMRREMQEDYEEAERKEILRRSQCGRQVI